LPLAAEVLPRFDSTRETGAVEPLDGAVELSTDKDASLSLVRTGVGLGRGLLVSVWTGRLVPVTRSVSPVPPLEKYDKTSRKPPGRDGTPRSPRNFLRSVGRTQGGYGRLTLKRPARYHLPVSKPPFHLHLVSSRHSTHFRRQTSRVQPRRVGEAMPAGSSDQSRVRWGGCWGSCSINRAQGLLSSARQA
jgi:hypothetical protein